MLYRCEGDEGRRWLTTQNYITYLSSLQWQHQKFPENNYISTKVMCLLLACCLTALGVFKTPLSERTGGAVCNSEEEEEKEEEWLPQGEEGWL